MVDLKIEQDEHIIRRTKEAWSFDGDEERELQFLVLTNKHIISVYEKSVALIFKGKTVVDKKPLSLISTIDDVLQVKNIIDDNFGESLQILFDNGMEELYFFGDAPKSEYQQWESAIKKAVIENNRTIVKNDEIPVAPLPSDENKQVVPVTMVEEKVSEKSDTPVFCISCGAKNNVGARFCQSCGTPLDAENKPKQSEESRKEEPYQQSTYSERRQEFAGKIIKCPNCGEVLGSFVALCPACGHELNSSKVSSTLERFIDQVNKFEELIANDQSSNRTGWSSWSKSKKVWWVIFNIFFTCIPLVIYLIFPLIRIKSTPKLSKEEKQMASLIENFPFPNDRESILEALVYTKEKIDFISKEKVDRKSAYWMRLWGSKAEQLKQKADLMFPNDTIVKQSYAEILADENKVNNIIKMKALAGVAILVLVIIYIFVRNGTIDDIRTANTVLEIPENELSSVMPQIEGGKGKVVTNNSTYFSVEYYGISDTEFENYKKTCKEQGFTIDCENTGSLFDAYNSDGYNIRITYYSKGMHITVTDAMEMRTIKWPDSVVANLLPEPKSNYGNIYSSSDTCLIVYIGNTSIDDYIEYVNACIEKGFDKDLSQTGEHYHADNEDGYSVMVEYRGFNTIFIRIDD